MPSKKHLHTYEKRPKVKGEKSGVTIYRCIDPDCSHKIVREDLFGKRANCPYCGEPYILNPRILRLKLPHCGCRQLAEQGIDVKIDAMDITNILLRQKKERLDAISEHIGE